MNQLQKVLESLETACGNRCNAEYNPCHYREAIAIVKQMMLAEPVAWLNWNAATGARTVSFEKESELASQALYYTMVTGDDLAEMTDLKEERERQRDSAVETIQELVEQRDALRAEFGPFEKYLNEGETPIQRLEREIKDGRALMKVYGKALAQIQELQQQQDTPVAFYEIAHDEDGEIEYEFSMHPMPGFRPLFAQAIAAAQAVPAGKPHCKECAKWKKEQSDNKEWIDGIAKGRRIVEKLAEKELKCRNL